MMKILKQMLGNDWKNEKYYQIEGEQKKGKKGNVPGRFCCWQIAGQRIINFPRLEKNNKDLTKKQQSEKQQRSDVSLRKLYFQLNPF